MYAKRIIIPIDILDSVRYTRSITFILSKIDRCFKLDEINVIHERMTYLYAYLISLKISVCETYFDKNFTLWNLEQS